jgi:predicted nucleotidyltransferase
MAKKEDQLGSGIYKVLMPLLEQKGLQVARIVLFGSYAKQCEDKDSDIDLIIVSQNFRNKSIFERVKLTTGIGRKLVKTFKKPFDLMFYSDLEWNHSRSIVIDAARNEGKELQSIM